MGGRSQTASDDPKKREWVVSQSALIRNLEADDPTYQDVAPVLALYDDLLWCAAVNQTLHTNCTPMEIADWPEETLWLVSEMIKQQAEKH